MWQGQKAEKALEAKRLETSIKGLRDNMRVLLNPFYKVGDIDQEQLAGQAFEFCDKVTRYKAVTAEIEAINKSLGVG